MKINLSYNQENGSTLTDSELTYDYIRYAVSNKHEKLNGQMRRIWGRIQRKFDEALLNKTDEVELEEAEKDFIKEAFTNLEVPTLLAKYFITLEDEIEKM